MNKYRIAQLQRITEIEQEVVMELFPGNFKPVKLPLQKRASYRMISVSQNNHNYSSQIQVFQRLFQEEYDIFEANHSFWELYQDSEFSENTCSISKISENHQNKNKIQNIISNHNRNESDSQEISSQFFNNLNYEDNKYPLLQQIKPNNLNKQQQAEQKYPSYQFIKKESDQQQTSKQNTFFKQEYVEKEILSPKQQGLDNSFTLSSFKSDFIENIIQIEHSNSKHNEQAFQHKNKFNSKNADSTTNNVKIYNKIEYQSDESEQNKKNQFSKKKNLKIERKSKERQKRSKYYERMAEKDQVQSDNEENNELYVQSRDALINGVIFETFGIRNKFINNTHWLFGDQDQSIKQRQEKAFNFLESFLKVKEKITNNNHLKRLEILNVCSFLIQSTQIHKEMQQYLIDSQIQNFEDSAYQTSLPIQSNIFAQNKINKDFNENNKQPIQHKSHNLQLNLKKQKSDLINNQQHQSTHSHSYFTKLETQNSSVSQEEHINAAELLNLVQIYYSKQLQAPQLNKLVEDENLSINSKINKFQQINNPNSFKKMTVQNRQQSLQEQYFDSNQDSKEASLKNDLLKFNQNDWEEIQQNTNKKQSQILFSKEEEQQFKKKNLNFNQQNQITNQEEKYLEIKKNDEITQIENVLNLDQQEQNSDIYNETSNSNSQAFYTSIIHKFFNISFKNQTEEDEFDFNNVKTSKSIYSNSDPSKKKFGIEVMVVNSDDDEIQVERIKKNYGKFHNFNKLFMYNIVKMFSECNLDNLGLPSIIIQEILNIVNKIKISARRRNNSNKEVQYDYFSIAHYNLLFFLIKNSNTQIIKNQFEYIHFYKKCFKINLQSDSQQQLSIISANIIKKYCFLIYMKSIQRSYQLSQESQSKTPRQEYILKATEGIQNLHQGNLVRRF
ncbi:hypothetical protein ABPG74_021241 [Tetrahymena malaccensis]